MYQKPKAAKRLYFDVVPRAVDVYRTWVDKAPGMEPAALLENPAWHIHAGMVPVIERADLGFAMLLNLASVCNAEDKAVLWGIISRYAPETTPAPAPLPETLSGSARNERGREQGRDRGCRA